MDEPFLAWDKEQERLNTLMNFPRPKRRQVWWCTIGRNIGSEQSCEKGYDRPVLVLKVFGSIFWGVPITSSDPEGKKKNNPLYLDITGRPYVTESGEEKQLEGWIATHQLRVFDSRRLRRKILRIDELLFNEILDAVRHHLQ